MEDKKKKNLEKRTGDPLLLVPLSLPQQPARLVLEPVGLQYETPDAFNTSRQQLQVFPSGFRLTSHEILCISH